MAELLLVNPRRRRKKNASRRRKRHVARKRHRAVKANPRRRHRRPAFMKANPRRRRARRSNPHRRTRHRRRSNPSLRGITGAIMPTVKSGAIGALGGLGLDLLWGKTSQYLPASVASSAPLQYAVKLLGAVLVGFVGNYALKGKGRDLAVGAATIVLHDALKATLQAQAPATFGPGGTLGLGLYLNGAAPIVGTASLPFTPVYSNQNTSTMGRLGRLGRMGAQNVSGTDLVSNGVGLYLNGLAGPAGDGTIYADDRIGDSDW